ncbi:hypothetical protein [Marinobacterium arenosum]|uniref:hypothetical protein n=1 Tax=Marinobacterium arenosum TaxID=2862496 RepID=UPI001C984157|nr:hypothetical protein [Marinobacterium arenosum]MBY4676943.1 hypothetical protein [Marinobacterium arenosum]
MSDSERLSTSALAKRLHKTAKQLFAELVVLGWIRREGENWQLTAKGEFEGGAYRDSEKFGRYIVWPESVLNHRALSSGDLALASSTALGRRAGLSAQQLNRLMQELGWLHAEPGGWQLTDAGRRAGGVAREDPRSGKRYALWPDNLLEQPAVARLLARLQPSDDGPYIALDGHCCSSGVVRRLDNWFYLAGIQHAFKRPLPLPDSPDCDLFLPQSQLYIDDWSGSAGSAELARRMRLQTLAEGAGLALLVVDEAALPELEAWLVRQLRKRNIPFE